MIEKFDVMFTPAGKTRKLHISLPNNYYDREDRYPVMYFFDGHNLYSDADATYGKSWGLEDFLQRWNKDIIVVGMECGHEEGERLAEYSPYQIRGWFLGDIDGTGVDTLNWMVNELKPVIDSRYRTYPFREATGIAGSSMGGLMSLYAAICYNAYFSKAACISSAIHSVTIPLTNDFLKSTISSDTRVYLSWGTEESGGTHENPDDDWKTETAGFNRMFSKMLEQRGARTKLFCQRGGGHCEADWEKQIPDFMNFLWMNCE